MGLVTKIVKIVAGTAVVGTAAGVVTKKLRKAKKAKEDPNAELLRTFEAFQKECLKSDESVLKAIDLLDELEKEMDKMVGAEPEKVSTYIESSLQEVGA